MKREKHWYDYLWLWTIAYFLLGFVNIFFAWLGMIDFLLPLGLAIFGGNKFFCGHLCGRGQLLWQLGSVWKLSRQVPTPRWLHARWFRWAFLAFFMTMFASLLLQTWLVAGGSAELREAVTVLWSFQVPWSWAYTPGLAPEWVAQFSFGFYSLMLSSSLLGLLVMALYKPRTWCTFCPMGMMTQEICKAKA